MYQVRKHCIRCSVLLAAATLVSCNQNLTPGGGGGGAGKIALPQVVSRFVVAAGEEQQGKAILQREQLSASGQLSLRLEQGDISFEADGSGGGTLLVSAAFGEVSGFDEACAEPVDSYGPFTVTVNANSQITGISPTGFEVAESTLDLVRGGSYTICVTFSSSIAGAVAIEAFTID